VAHVRALAAWCRRAREPLPLLSFEQRYMGWFHARASRVRDAAPPSARAASAWRARGAADDGGAEELLDAAVQELVTRLRGREDALLYDEVVRAVRGEGPRAQHWPPGLELHVLRDELSAADATIRRLSASLAARRTRGARRFAASTPRIPSVGPGTGRVAVDADERGGAPRGGARPSRNDESYPDQPADADAGYDDYAYDYDGGFE
jgi:hypothetical protein